jgi:hypothetical protein
LRAAVTVDGRPGGGVLITRNNMGGTPADGVFIFIRL